MTLDHFDRATSIDGPAISAITRSFGSDGQLASQADPNGNTTTLTYDAVGREKRRDTNGTAAR